MFGGACGDRVSLTFTCTECILNVLSILYIQFIRKTVLIHSSPAVNITFMTGAHIITYVLLTFSVNVH